MSEFRDKILRNLKERGVSLDKIINNLDIDSPICSCFITAYTGADEKINQKNNKKLENDLFRLGYRGYKKILGGYKYSTDNTIYSEPGFLVSCKRSLVNPDTFKEEMISLGKRYEQEAILLKIPGEKPAYYNTKGEQIGSLQKEFDKIKKIDVTKHIDEYPNDEEAWKDGYTQLQKDKNKHKNQGFTTENLDEMNFNTLLLTEDEIEALTSNNGIHTFSGGTGHILRAYLRSDLGLSPYGKPIKSNK